jgi:hypothetical protein
VLDIDALLWNCASMTLGPSSGWSKETLTIKIGGARRALLRKGSRALRSAFRKSAVLGQGGHVAGAMQNPNDHKLTLIVQVVDGVVAGKTYT